MVTILLNICQINKHLLFYNICINMDKLYISINIHSIDKSIIKLKIYIAVRFMKLLIFFSIITLKEQIRNKIIWRIRGSNPDPFDMESNTLSIRSLTYYCTLYTYLLNIYQNSRFGHIYNICASGMSQLVVQSVLLHFNL